jgi:ribonuclease HII
VVAAAVILDPDRIPSGIDDSKALDADARERVYVQITTYAVAVGIGVGEVERIDRDNILAATMWAMSEAVARLGQRPRLAIVDGNRTPRLACKTRAIVRGDSKCLSIAAASIVAKVSRDRLMMRLGEEWPGYGFEQHMGYGVPFHLAALRALGPTMHHRRSFAPIAAFFSGQSALPLESDVA